MSAPRIKVEYVWDDDAYTDVIPEWRCLACTHGLHDYPAGTWGVASTLSAAADAGRAHLARFHTALMPPDPYCSVHESHPAYCVESHDALTDPEPVSTYCGTHGTRRDECECGSGKSPTGDENGAYNATQPFGDDSPCCTTPMQHAHTHSREDC